ncbi:MAG: hypothetical protein E7282_07270 [Lachnospiraceae bacterium]|nr:hypothetical protein [Lachnospiraceae bacterium]
MLERNVIQSVGFRNTKCDGRIDGFQFKVRLPYYRGVYLCQLRLGDLYIDEKRIDPNAITWCVDGCEYTAEQMRQNCEVNWAVTEPATVKVQYDGGLPQGFHDIKYGFCFSSSYMPPMMQSEEALDPNKESMIFLPEFGKHVNERRLLIV